MIVYLVASLIVLIGYYNTANAKRIWVLVLLLLLLIGSPLSFVAMDFDYDDPASQQSTKATPPRIRPNFGCKIVFHDSNMNLCHLVAYGANFGDEIGPVVAKEFLERRFQCSAEDIPVINIAKGSGRRNRKCLFNLGSIFHYVKDNDHVWATGINPKHQKEFKAGVTYHAVRGKLTLEQLQSHNIVPPVNDDNNSSFSSSMPLGDPGSALIHLYPEFRWENNGKQCFVPHHHDEAKFIKQMTTSRKFKQIRVVSVKDSWRNVTDKLRTCATVASSSLHGLVIADALGIPNRWFQYKGGKTERTEGHFKYQDYFSTIQRTNATALSNIQDLLDSSNYWDAPSSEIMDKLATQLEKSFPYHLFRVIEK